MVQYGSYNKDTYKLSTIVLLNNKEVHTQWSFQGLLWDHSCWVSGLFTWRDGVSYLSDPEWTESVQCNAMRRDSLPTPCPVRTVRTRCWKLPLGWYLHTHQQCFLVIYFLFTDSQVTKHEMYNIHHQPSFNLKTDNFTQHPHQHFLCSCGCWRRITPSTQW